MDPNTCASLCAGRVEEWIGFLCGVFFLCGGFLGWVLGQNVDR